LNIRRREIVPHLPHTQFGSAQCDGTVLTAHWPLGNETTLILLANLGDAEADRPSHFQSGRTIWGGNPASTLPAWAVFWSIGAVGCRLRFRSRPTGCNSRRLSGSTMPPPQFRT